MKLYKINNLFYNIRAMNRKISKYKTHYYYNSRVNKRGEITGVYARNTLEIQIH